MLVHFTLSPHPKLKGLTIQWTYPIGLSCLPTEAEVTTITQACFRRLFTFVGTQNGFRQCTNHTLKLKTIRTIQYRLGNFTDPQWQRPQFQCQSNFKIMSFSRKWKIQPPRGMQRKFSSYVMEFPFPFSFSYRPSKLKQHFSRIS